MTSENELNYRVVGQGHPIIFLHGFLENNSMWNHAVNYYSTSNKCVLIELFGHGDSPLIEQNPTLEKFSRAVVNLINKERIKDFTLVGHSLGGYVALEVLKTEENRVKQIILLNSHPWEDSAVKKQERTKVAEIIEKNKSLFLRQAIPNLFKDQKANESIINDLIEQANNMSKKAIIDTTIAMRDRPQNTDVFLANKEKALVIQGEYDHLIPAEKMRFFCETNNISYRLIKNGDHMCWVNKNIYPFSL